MLLVLVCFTKVAADTKAPILGFILQYSLNIGGMAKIMKRVQFFKNNATIVFLLQYNKIFAIYVTISSLSLVHDDDASDILHHL